MRSDIGEFYCSARRPFALRYHELMRAVVVYLTLLLLLALSVGVGYLASDWPRVCAARQWCAAGWPRPP
jgi:hypothetical protein